MKVVYIGKEGSGKTFLMGGDTIRCIDRNYNWYRKVLEQWSEKIKILEMRILRAQKLGSDISKYQTKLDYLKANKPQPRSITSNIAYSESLENYAKSKGIPIRYWKDIEELENMTETDLFIDEIGAYFDSRTYTDLPLTTRLWLAQAQKLGVHIYGGAQDWGQIDVSFRRLVNRLYEVKKVIGTRRPSLTTPERKHPWAIIFTWSVAPEADSDSTALRTRSILPAPYFAGKEAFARFDTNARIADNTPPPLKRIVRHWYDENGKIGYTRTVYR